MRPAPPARRLAACSHTRPVSVALTLAVSIAAAPLLAAAPAVAATAGSPYTASFPLGKADSANPGAVYDPATDSTVVVYHPASAAGADAPGTNVEVCVLPRGARACRTRLALPSPAPGVLTPADAPLISLDGGALHVLSRYTGAAGAAGAGIYLSTSTDGGASFGAPILVGELPTLSAAVFDGPEILLASGREGLHVQWVPADGSGPAVPPVTVTTESPTTDWDVAATRTGSGQVLAVVDTDSGDDQMNGDGEAVAYVAATDGATFTRVTGFDDDALTSLQTGDGQTWLVLGSLEDGSMPSLERWNGSAFLDRTYEGFPDPVNAMAVDPEGRLHVVDDYGTGGADYVSANGGASFRTSTFGPAPAKYFFATVLAVDTTGAGVALGLGTDGYVTHDAQLIVQPLPVEPTLHLSYPRRLVAHRAFTVTGSEAPATAGLRVSLQRKAGRTWVTVAKGSQSRSGSFSLRAPALARGNTTYRVLADGRAGVVDQTLTTFTVSGR